MEYFNSDAERSERERVRAWMNGQQQADDQAASVTAAWDAHIRGIVEERCEILREAASEFVAETIADLRKDISGRLGRRLTASVDKVMSA